MNNASTAAAHAATRLSLFPDAGPVPSTCSCCGVAIDDREWAAMEYVGICRYPWLEVHELRNCKCRSTLVRVLDRGEEAVAA